MGVDGVEFRLKKSAMADVGFAVLIQAARDGENVTRSVIARGAHPFFATFARRDADLTGENRKAFRVERNVGDPIRAARTVEKKAETRFDVVPVARFLREVARFLKKVGFARILRELAIRFDVVVIDDRRTFPIELTARSGEKRLL